MYEVDDVMSLSKINIVDERRWPLYDLGSDVSVEGNSVLAISQVWTKVSNRFNPAGVDPA